MQYKISFIVPVYNAKQYLSECIDSITSQDSFESIELILVNDGSTDGSTEICDMYASNHENIKAIHQKNSGVSAARNNGISACEGEYVSFIDADDYLLDGIISKLIAALGSSPDLLFYNYIAEYKEFCDYVKYPFNKGCLNEDAVKKDIPEFMLISSSFSSVWNKLFKKSIITDNSISFPVGKKYGEDREFVLSFLSRCKSAYYLCEDGYFYRYVKSGAIQKSRDDYIKNLYSDFEYNIEFYKRFNIDTDTVYNKCREFLAEQIVVSVIVAFRNCDAKAFKEMLLNLFNDERFISDVESFYKNGFYKSQRELKIAESILNKKPNKIRRYLKIKQFKSDVYAVIHDTKNKHIKSK